MPEAYVQTSNIRDVKDIYSSLVTRTPNSTPNAVSSIPIYQCADDFSGSLEGPFSVLSAFKRLRDDRKRRRVKMRYHLESRALHWGIVWEPYLTPLLAFNVLMREFGAAPITPDEARTAVARVATYYAHDFSPSPAPYGAGLTSRGGPSPSSFATSRSQAWSASPSPLATSQGSILTALHASQVATTQGGREGPTASLQDALLVEVLRELCGDARRRGCALRVSRMADRDVRRMRGRRRLGPIDVPPRRRAVLLADRHDPAFALVYGITHRARGRDGAGERPGSDAVNLEDPFSARPYMQLLTVAHRPMPWRRIIKTHFPSLSVKELVVAFVEKVEGEDLEGEEAAALGSPSFTAPLVLGEWEASRSVGHDGEEGLDSKNRRKKGIDGLSSPSSAASSDHESEPSEGGEGTKTAEDILENSLSRAARPFFTRENTISDDPLLSIPRTGDETYHHGRRRKHWLERLLPKGYLKGPGSFLSDIHDYPADD